MKVRRVVFPRARYARNVSLRRICPLNRPTAVLLEHSDSLVQDVQMSHKLLKYPVCGDVLLLWDVLLTSSEMYSSEMYSWPPVRCTPPPSASSHAVSLTTDRKHWDCALNKEHSSSKHLWTNNPTSYFVCHSTKISTLPPFKPSWSKGEIIVCWEFFPLLFTDRLWGGLLFAA